MSNNNGQVIGDATTLELSDQLGRYTQGKLKRSEFPANFIFGSATSAYQVEGAWATGGKGLSNWDAFCLRTPSNIEGGNNGCVAIDQYNMSREDVALLKRVGLDSYRFSISWSRILPGGKLSAGINREGIKYYSDLIDMLLAEGIEPCVTIFHWDVPQCLEDEYSGFLSPRIVKDYCDFAEVCFWEFGDRVKYWITLNEPWAFAVSGYVIGSFPPGRTGSASIPVTSIAHHRYRAPTRSSIVNTAGDPGTEPYIVAHHLILSHAAAVAVYKKRYQGYQRGQIGMTNVSIWCEPLNSKSQVDSEACLRAIDFMLGWFVAPLVFGDYPTVMRQNVGNRLPEFTPNQVELVQGSYDFLGINYYTTNYCYNSPRTPDQPISYATDQEIGLTAERGGVPIGEQAGSEWLYIVPYGIHRLLKHIKQQYNNPIIYITENGVDEKNNVDLTASQARFDETRINAFQDHLSYVKQAIDEGVDVRAFYLWSMFDNFEWAAGYSVRFGIFYVDYVNGQLTRIPKLSAIWFANFLSGEIAPNKKQAKENEGETGSVKRLRSN